MTIKPDKPEESRYTWWPSSTVEVEEKLNMSKKHFELIARVLKDYGLSHPRILITKMADALAETNPNFDRDRFISACGGISPSNFLGVEHEDGM